MTRKKRQNPPPQLAEARREFQRRGRVAHMAKHPHWSSPCAICGTMYLHSYARYPKTCGSVECVRAIHLRALDVARANRAKRKGTDAAS